MVNTVLIQKTGILGKASRCLLAYLLYSKDEIDVEVEEMVKRVFPEHPGAIDLHGVPTSLEQHQQALEHAKELLPLLFSIRRCDDNPKPRFVSFQTSTLCHQSSQIDAIRGCTNGNVLFCACK